MWKNYNLYVPGDYTFDNYFLPRIKNPILETFPVNARRFGVQRKGNNHLVVFLDFYLKKPPSEFTGKEKGETGDFDPRTPGELGIFKRKFGGEKEVSVYTVSFHPRMSAIAWNLLIDIVDDDHVLAKDDHGHWSSGPDCARDLGLLFKKV